LHIGHLVPLERSSFACVARIEWHGEKVYEKLWKQANYSCNMFVKNI
jgi:hypothetical protein